MSEPTSIPPSGTETADGPVWDRRPRSGGEDTYVLVPVFGSKRILGIVAEVRPGAFFAQPTKAPSVTRATLTDAQAYVVSTLPSGRSPRVKPEVAPVPDLFSSP